MAFGKIKEFDVNSGNWTLYCERVEMYLCANSIKDELKLPTLISLVGDEVYELMVNLANPKKPTDLTYKEVIALVRNHLQPKPSVMAERYKFRQRRQESGEIIVQYVATLKKMAKDCDFGQALNENLRDQFVCGVRSELIRQRLFSEPDLTYAKAVSLATALEAAERDAAAVDASASSGSGASAVMSSVLHVAAQQQRNGRTRQYARPSTEKNHLVHLKCTACGGQHQTEGCRYTNFVCNSCKNKGHLKKVCPFKDGGKRWREPGTRRDGRRTTQDAHYVKPAVSDEDSVVDSEVGEPLFQMALGDYSPVSLDILVNGARLEMEVDTGTSCSCINKVTYEKLFSNVRLEKSKYVFMFYDGKSKVRPLGYIKADVEYNKVRKKLDLFVIEKGVTSLIGRQWLSELKIQIPILRYDRNETESFKIEPVNDELRDILNRYKDVLSDGLGRYSGGCATLRVREGAAPVFHRARPVPFALRERVDTALDAMLRDGVIEPVDSSDWATPLVLVPKSDGTLRICADFKVTLNPVLMVDRYPLPKVDELLANLAEGEEYTKIDLSQAYNQICLSEESKRFTVVNTHRGLFRYNRLVYGLASSSGIFQRIISNVVKDIPGVQCFADDLILTAKNRTTHLQSLRALFDKLQAAGLKIKSNKCSFLKSQVRYLGFVVDKDGIRPDPDKLRAIKNMPRPSNVSELKSFLGMVNFYARFVRNLSDILHPLHELLRDGTPWVWTPGREKAFERVKQLLMSSRVLAHYDPRRELVLTCDASAVGVGGVLSQLDECGVERAVAYVSRKLTKAEHAYAQIHREALAIVYCVKKFHQYIYGRKFQLKTDHKPLVSIFGPQKGIPTMAASRMQRWALILSAYEFDIRYVNTSSNGADVLSRLPVVEKSGYEPPEQTYLHFATEAMLLDNDMIRKATARDPLLCRVHGYIENGWPEQVDVKQLEPYQARKSELYIEVGCVMWGHRLVVPESCRQLVLRELHGVHMGIVKTKAYARSYVWWPGIDEAVEAACRACGTCAAVAPAPPHAPPTPWRWPHSPYERVHLDFLGPIDGQTYLITVDARSKWIEAFRMTRTTADATISKLRQSWSRWGIPKQVVSDNGPPFSSKQFRDFLHDNGIYQSLSAPYHPSSNGAAENAVKIIKNVIKKARRERVDPELAIQRYLLVYHNTPHSATGEAPAQLLQGRRLRTRLDVIRPDHGSNLRNKELEAAQCAKGSRQLNPGDQVWYRNFGTTATKWSKGQIADRFGRNSYTIKTDNDSAAHRHIDQLKRRSTCVFPSDSGDGTDGVVGSGPAALESPSAAGGVATTASAVSNIGGAGGSCSSPMAIETNKNSYTAPCLVEATHGTVPDIQAGRNVVNTTKRLIKPVAKYGFEID